MAIFKDMHSSITGTAGASETDGYKKYNFICKTAVNFIANDSTDSSLQVNFDSPVGQAGTITLFAGEAISDLKVSCRELYVRGVGKAVPFRALGY